MVTISDNNIVYMSAGEYLELPLFINGGSLLTPCRYIMQENDRLYFSIYEPNEIFEHGVVRKILTNESLNKDGDPVVKLTTEDTCNLEKGLYYYEAKLKYFYKNQEYWMTIIPARKFYIID